MERIDIEERYNSLAEEVAGKTKKLNKVAALLAITKAEYADLHQEQQREMEGTLENMRSVTKDLQLSDLIINEHIPSEYYVSKVLFVHLVMMLYLHLTVLTLKALGIL